MRLTRICGGLALAVGLGLGMAGTVPGRANAQGIDDLAGRWRGEGRLTLNDEPAQRFRCQIRLRPADARRVVYSGRCATAQGAQSFVYVLTIEGGAVLAQNTSQPPDDLPAQMHGTLGDGVLRFSDPGGALFELRPHPEGLAFRLEGDGPEGRARGEVVLRRQADTD
ncbi:MAG: hypothetical protein ACK4LQ_03555 [Pararhodobacter sp.]